MRLKTFKLPPNAKIRFLMHETFEIIAPFFIQHGIKLQAAPLPVGIDKTLQERHNCIWRCEGKFGTLALYPYLNVIALTGNASEWDMVFDLHDPDSLLELVRAIRHHD
jgi:hypothetical protein